MNTSREGSGTGGGVTRRSVLNSTAAIGAGALWSGSGHGSTLRPRITSHVTIDRTVDDLVVLPADPDVTVTGTSTLEPGTDFTVRVASEESPTFLKTAGTSVSSTGAWSATFDLTDATDGQEFTIDVIRDGETVASAPGLIGPLSATVSFGDQTLEPGDSTVVIDEVNLELGGFVAVYEEDTTGPIVGVSGFLLGGETYANLPISLDSSIDAETVLVAAAHLDTDGDRTFDFVDDPSVDRPYEVDGEPVIDAAVVSVPTPTQTPTPTRTPTPTPPPRRPGSGADVAAAGSGGVVGVWALRKVRATLRNDGDDYREGENRPPNAQIVFTPEAPEPGRPVLFDGSLSFDPDPDDHVVAYSWDIGGNNPTGRRVIHVFGQSGEVDVELVVTDTHGATGAQTETVAVEETEGTLEIERVHPDAPGRDPPNLQEECVTFRNAGDAALELDGWTIHDAAEADDGVTAGDHTVTIPDGVALDPGATLTVHTGSRPESEEFEETATDRHLFLGKRRPVWNDGSGVVVVCDDTDHPVLAGRYERTDAEEYEIEQLDANSLADWFPPVTVDEEARSPTPNASVDSRIGVTAVSNAIDFVAGAFFLRGPDGFVSSWALVTGFLFTALVTWLLSTATGFLAPSIAPVGPIVLLLGALSMTIVGEVLVLSHRAIEYLVGS